MVPCFFSKKPSFNPKIVNYRSCCLSRMRNTCRTQSSIKAAFSSSLNAVFTTEPDELTEFGRELSLPFSITVALITNSLTSIISDRKRFREKIVIQFNGLNDHFAVHRIKSRDGPLYRNRVYNMPRDQRCSKRLVRTRIVKMDMQVPRAEAKIFQCLPAPLLQSGTYF